MKKKIRSVVLAVLSILLIFIIPACSTRNIYTNPGEEFYLKFGQTASIQGEDMTIKFTQVVSDSRCPSGVQCVWQGEVTCLLEINYQGSTYSKTLTQSGLTSDLAKAEFQNYQISFNVSPILPQANN